MDEFATRLLEAFTAGALAGIVGVHLLRWLKSNFQCAIVITRRPQPLKRPQYERPRYERPRREPDRLRHFTRALP